MREHNCNNCDYGEWGNHSQDDVVEMLTDEEDMCLNCKGFSNWKMIRHKEEK